MKRIYINKGDVTNVLKAITREQTKRNTFLNVFVKPYRGKKHDPENTTVIVIG